MCARSRTSGPPKAIPARWGDDVRRARVSARRYLRFGVRSTAELRSHLHTSRIPAVQIDAIVTSSTREGLLDDHACARLVANTLAERGYAVAAIRERLLAKGLEPALTARVLQTVREDDDARARAVVAARLRRGSRSDPRLRARLVRLLAQRGFDSDLIDRVLAESFSSISE